MTNVIEVRIMKKLAEKALILVLSFLIILNIAIIPNSDDEEPVCPKKINIPVYCELKNFKGI